MRLRSSTKQQHNHSLPSPPEPLTNGPPAPRRQNSAAVKQKQKTPRTVSPPSASQHFPLLDLQDDLLLHIFNLLPPTRTDTHQDSQQGSRKSLRETCQRLKRVVSLTFSHLQVTKALHQELDSCDRRRALCLSLSSRLPSISSLAVDTCPPALLPRILSQLTSLTELETGEAPITTSIASSLSALPSLTSLTIVSTPTILPSLPPSPTLHSLHIFLAYKHTRSRVVNLSLSHLLHFPALTSLALHHLLITHTSPNLLEPLAALPHLRAFHYCCSHCYHTPSQGLNLAPLTQLTYVSVPAYGCITLSSLPLLTNLVDLSLNGPCTASDLGVWAAKPVVYPSLTSLTVYCGMLAPPARLVVPRLRSLNVHEVMEEMDVEVAAALRQMLPLPLLTTLRLHTPTLDVAETVVLLQLVAQHTPQLQDLALEGTFTQPAVEALSQLTALTSLQLQVKIPFPSGGARDSISRAMEGLRWQLPSIQLFRLELYHMGAV